MTTASGKKVVQGTKRLAYLEAYIHPKILRWVFLLSLLICFAMIAVYVLRGFHICQKIAGWLNANTILLGSAPIDIDRYIKVAKSDSTLRLIPSEAATGPLRVDPANPRYFSDGSGKVVYLAGSHFWDNLQDSGNSSVLPYLFDYDKWLDFLQANHHNFFRLWAWEEARWVSESPANYVWQPNIYARPGPGTALDGLSKFDVTQFNQAYFDRMRQRILDAGNRGLYVSIMLFDGWSITNAKACCGNNPWHAHPFNVNNNINGINGDTNNDDQGFESEDLSVAAITALQEAYVRKVVDTVNDLPNVLYEIANEADGCHNAVPWENHFIDYLHSYEAAKPKQHPVGFSVPYPCGNNSDLFASHADWIEPNGADSTNALYNPPATTGAKVVVADTDHLCGICGDRIWVWEGFMRGENLLFMDQYDDSYKLDGGGYNMNNPNDVSLRANLGYTQSYAQRLNMHLAVPHGELTSTGYALANPASEYLVYAPSGGSFSVDLRAVAGALTLEWFNPSNGTTTNGGTVNGGGTRTLTPPFSGDAVLYLRKSTSTATPTPLPGGFDIFLPFIWRR